MALGCVTGRFQPLHRGHLDLIRRALSTHGQLIIGVTNPDPSRRAAVSSNAARHRPEANPFTYYERVQMVRAGLDAGLGPRVEVVPFPLHDPAVWAEYVPLSAWQWVRAYSRWEQDKAALLADGGYRVELLRPGTAKPVSATRIRSQLAAGDERWRDDVPSGVAALVDAFLAAAPLPGRERASQP